MYFRISEYFEVRMQFLKNILRFPIPPLNRLVRGRDIIMRDGWIRKDV